MSLKDTVKGMHMLLEELSKDLTKAFEKGNKTASQRVRTNSIKFAKLSKEYRKESILHEGTGKKTVKKKSTRSKTVAEKKKVAKKRKAR